MKFRTTKKDIMSNFATVIKVGYCAFCTALKYSEPVAYTRGTYGWNADIYLPGGRWKGVAIVTGYRPFGNVHSIDLTAKYEDLARKAEENNNFGPVEAFDLIDQYIDEVISNNN